MKLESPLEGTEFRGILADEFEGIACRSGVAVILGELDDVVEVEEAAEDVVAIFVSDF